MESVSVPLPDDESLPLDDEDPLLLELLPDAEPLPDVELLPPLCDDPPLEERLLSLPLLELLDGERRLEGLRYRRRVSSSMAFSRACCCFSR